MSSLTSRALFAPVIPDDRDQNGKNMPMKNKHTHGSTKTSIDFEDGKLVQI
jgi:hypothetical protein